MSTRMNYFEISPRAMKILLDQEQYLNDQFSGEGRFRKTHGELVKLRVSQLNRCAYCLDMHSKDALKLGETVQRIAVLPAWRDTPFFDESERMALEWAETLTAGEAVTEELYGAALDIFGEIGVLDLTLTVNAINSWNRIAKVFCAEVGSYQPA